MISNIIVTFLTIITLVFIFTTWNLLKKNEKLEDVVESHNIYFKKINDSLDYAEDKLKEIDNKGIFKNDDEVGFIYTQIRELSRFLLQFRRN